MTVVVLLVFDGCDVMDVTGPYEVLLTANRLRERTGDPPPFDVRTVSPDGRPVTAYGGLGLVPSHGGLDEATDADLLIVPGLIDLDRGLADAELLEAIRSAAEVVPMIGSVCTGAFLLHEAGVLGEAAVTTHWEDVDDLRDRRSGEVRDGVRWVDDGRVVTGGGLSSGIAMALHLVARDQGRQLAEATARQIDYVWSERR